MSTSTQINAHWSNTAVAYNRWALQHFRSEPIRNVWLPKLAEWIGPKRLHVLDVGTGPGIMAFYLAELGHCVTGFDQAEGMLQMARANAKELNLEVHFEQGDAHRLPYADASFDVVVNRLVFAQMLQPEAALREWARVIKPGGRLIVIDGDALKVRRKLWHKVWKLFSIPFVYITEGRNPVKNRMPIRLWNQLPLVNVDRPAWERKNFTAIGLQDVRVEVIRRLSLGWLEYIKHGCWGNYWAVMGRKPEV